MQSELGFDLRVSRLSADRCAAWVDGVVSARAAWVDAFDGEQFSVGRAFYTHLEQDRAREYFDAAEDSDADVERIVPGLQDAMRGLVAEATGGEVVRRPGFCGPGVHVFPAGGVVARRGGVIHFDDEGLTAHHLVKRKRAITIVAMLQPPVEGGGLRIWDALYRGDEHPTADDLRRESRLLTYRRGDVLAMDSYRLHQIQPFAGDVDRISATVHAAEIDAGRWETWF